MQPGTPPPRDRNWRGWIIAALAALVLIVLLVLWAMRPDRQGLPGEPADGYPTGTTTGQIAPGPGVS